MSDRARNYEQPQLSVRQIRARVQRQVDRWHPPETASQAMVVITAEHLAGFRHTFRALFKLGVLKNGEWPPPRGWREALLGSEVWVWQHQLDFIGRISGRPVPHRAREVPAGFTHSSTCLERRGRGSCSC